MRIALGIEYDGSGFHGWQTQPSGRAIQDHLESALSRFIGSSVSTICAGRTDTGVHAVAQVVHFDADVEREPMSWVRGTNSFLDPRIRVVWANTVSTEFHARFSAVNRTYQYLLLNETVGPALMQGRAGWFHAPLNEKDMNDAARLIVGQHDFSAFRAAECQAKSPIRSMLNAQVQREGTFIIFSFTANAFLHHMIRNLVGSLVYVGAGRQPTAWISELLLSRDRKNAAPTFAPDGLYLTAVDYGSAYNLPSFARRLPYFQI